jgi:hypothetical protein
MRQVIVYGIASGLSGDLEDFHGTREEAEATLAQILADEPEFEGQLWCRLSRSRYLTTDSRGAWRHACRARLGSVAVACVEGRCPDPEGSPREVGGSLSDQPTNSGVRRTANPTAGKAPDGAGV